MAWSREFSGLQSRLLAYRNYDEIKRFPKKGAKMSADNGWILRKNLRGEFVVQTYFASEDHYPSIDNVPISQVFNNVENALTWYERHAGYSEYGLTVQIQKNDEKANKNE